MKRKIKNKKPINLSQQNCEDIWSGMQFWLDRLDKKKNPNTARSVAYIIKRIRSHSRKFN